MTSCKIHSRLTPGPISTHRRRTLVASTISLPHESLNVTSTNIVRNGLTTKATIYTGPRYPTVGQEHTEASDHCPTSVVLDL